ncbi:hypothetical protein E2562_017643 [Oryza meyeriana var. granulata]|uniref:DUF834 domain-containing protein n=1 Tax=Oryza meyeriana var. granulata TaxID=110450 RepID=A0A6G1BWD6_9ORYZ|nr:hypothetical protein E2562_017643 [Oryza meyeriana var. granulata]
MEREGERAEEKGSPMGGGGSSLACRERRPAGEGRKEGWVGPVVGLARERKEKKAEARMEEIGPEEGAGG